MSKSEYIVEITRENNSLSGKMQKVKNGKNDTKDTIFDPTIFLIDLYKKDTNHLLANDVKNVFGFKFDNLSATHDLMFVDILNKFVRENKTFDLYDLEKFKVLFDVNVNYAVYYKIATYTTDDLNAKPIKSENYMPYLYHSDNAEDIFNQDIKCHKYKYICNDITEILFAIFHYLMMNKYKVATCRHCEKRFFTNSFKNMYCKRKSPYKKYDHLECEQAVRNISQKFKKRRDNLYGRYMTYDKDNDKAYAFSDEVKPFTDKVKISPTVANLKEYENFLYVTHGKKEI